MAVLDRSLRRVAKTLIRKFGAPVTVTLIDKAADYNTATGRESSTSTVVNTHALDLGKGKQSQSQPGSITRVKGWLVPAIDFTTRPPRSNDVVTRAGTQHRITEVVTYETGELAGLHELRVAR
jgi:hypothetical protein